MYMSASTGARYGTFGVDNAGTGTTWNVDGWVKTNPVTGQPSTDDQFQFDYTNPNAAMYRGVVWGCVFEDFLARDLDDGRNIVDDYLKRRGWNESASNKAYMRALRSSVMSLYEISDIVREESFLARDLVRGGEPIRVSE